MSDAAKRYASRGWCVLPVEPHGKRPLLKNWPELATNDVAKVEELFAPYPNANIGIATGVKSGFFVIDVDPDNGGLESLAQLEATHGPLPHTVEQRTGSGGRHLLFQITDYAIHNSASKIAKGIDIRGNGGQIVVAPSATSKGSYSWTNPPESTEIAQAPAWVHALLRPTQDEIAAPRPQRAVFPKASPEILADASETLVDHGYAIEGEGGDHHTFVAAAILTHDYALTEAEAWPLLLEWNAKCRPPWNERDLRAKLRGADKYASGAYGKHRTADAFHVAKAEIAAWNSLPGSKNPVELTKRIREFQFGDPTERAIILKELQGVTGLAARDLALPAAKSEQKRKPDGILITPDLSKCADQATQAIADDVYHRSGLLCETVTHDVVSLRELQVHRILDLMSARVPFLKDDEKRGPIRQQPPLAVAQIIHARQQHADCIRPIESVLNFPVMLADGSLLEERGYNAQARCYLDPNVEVTVSEAPTQQDAANAVRLFQELLSDFKFAAPEDFSSWLAALLSPLVKVATKNAPAPLCCISASTPGAGKTLLIDVLSTIITGNKSANKGYNTKDSVEWGKRLTGFVYEARPIGVFDNCNGVIGDEALDRLLTSSVWSDRLLGSSDIISIPVVTTWIANGNNIAPSADTTRRSMMCRIEVDVERPQERQNFKIKNLLEHVTKERSTLLSAALTILKGYYAAGKPDQNLPTWGSFETWSDVVRSAVVWAGAPDPFLTQSRASEEMNEDDRDAHRFWIDCVEASGDGTAKEIADTANQNNAQDVLSLRDPVNAFTLRRFMGRFIGKVIDRKRICRKTRRSRQLIYFVQQLP